MQNQQNIIAQVDPGTDGWWLGEINGRTGLFPVNYVQTDLTTQSPAVRETSADSATKTAEASKLSAAAMASMRTDLSKILANRKQIIDGPDCNFENERRSVEEEQEPVEAGETAAFESSEQQFPCVAEALFDYQAADVDELEFLKGDRITHIDKVFLNNVTVSALFVCILLKL